MVTYKVYALEYFRGYLRRLAVNLVMYLVYDMERALNSLRPYKVVILVIRDVVRAFNAVYKNRLTFRLRI